MEPVLSDVADATFTAKWGSPPTERLPLRSSPSDSIDSLPFICVDAAALGDIPARYTITCVQDHELPAIGVYVDPRIVPGFRYRVRILPDLSECDHRRKSGKPLQKLNHLFDGKPLSLESIGRGYCRRMVFEPNPGCLNENDNYFWTDSHAGGFALELNVIAEGDQFHVFDETDTPVGLVEVFEIVGHQNELSESMTTDSVTKEVQVKFHCRAERRNTTTETSFTTMSGVVQCIKKKGSRHAVIEKIHSLKISGEIVDGLLLKPVKQK